MRNPEQVLNILAGHSNEPEYKYERLYRILFNEQMFFAAVGFFGDDEAIGKAQCGFNGIGEAVSKIAPYDDAVDHDGNIVL